MGYKLELHIPGLPKLPNQTLRGNWRSSLGEARKWKNFVLSAVLEKGLRGIPLQIARITYIRYSSSEPDFDGLVGSFKHVQDGLVFSQIIINDKPSNLSCSYHWVKAPRGKGKISVLVEEVS